MYSLVVTAKMNGVDPQAWLTDVLSVSQLILPIDWMNCCRGMDAASVSYFSPGRLIMHVNNVHHVTTINRVAKDLGEDEDWISDVANEVEPLKSSSGD